MNSHNPNNSNIQNTLNQITQSIQKIYAEKLNMVILYGSYARGDYSVDSDIDIMVVINDTREGIKRSSAMVRDIVCEWSLQNDKILSVIEEPLAEFDHYKTFVPFYKNVSSEGVVLYAS